MSCSIFENVRPNAINGVSTVYTGDDAIFHLSQVLGATVQFDPTVAISINLIDGAGVLQLGTWQSITNGGFLANNYAAGKVCGYILNGALDLLPRGRYRLVIRVGDANLSQTFVTSQTVILGNLI
jgi:hypothetical protein